MKEIVIKFDRELCCHSIGQCLDEIIQQILYSRSQIPCLVGELLKAEGDNESINKHPRRKSCQFSDEFRRWRTSIREIFRSINRDKLFQAAFLIGDAPISPKDIYFVEFKIVLDDDNDVDSNCQALNEKEFKNLSRSLICDTTLEDLKKISISKCFLFIEARRDAELQHFGFIPRTDLNLKRFSTLKKNHLNAVSMILTSGFREKTTNSNELKLIESIDKLNLNVIDNESQPIWFMYETPLVGFSA